MNYQMSIFDGEQKFNNNKPIRLIELFAGYGSQSLALKYLGIPFEHYRISEWAINSIFAYKDLHFDEDKTDYSKDKSIEEIKQWLCGKISSNYSTPLTEEQIKRLSEQKARTIYSDMIATHNVGSISKISAKDLAVNDTEKYLYIMTYSFPCQDLSSAGKCAGMNRWGHTRSGLLWEVERLLLEMEEKPQVLIMENVPEVIGKKNIKDFAEWVKSLDEMGYYSKWGILNAKDFGIPQNRNRCFMISILGNYYYNMPKKFQLQYKLKDFLDNNVDDCYYLKQSTIESLNSHKERHDAKGNGFGWKPTDGGGCATTIITESGYRSTSNFILSQPGGADGITFGRSEKFTPPPLKNCSRTIDTQSKNGVVIWSENMK